jgi:hypothetical protein
MGWDASQTSGAKAVAERNGLIAALEALHHPKSKGEAARR